MSKLLKKHQAAFYNTQKEVGKLLRPYLARNVSQYFTSTDAIEVYQVFSREADEPDDRHAWRGLVTVWYGFHATTGPDGEARCAVNFSFDEAMLSKALGAKFDNTYDGTASLLAAVMPPRPINTND